MDDAISRQIVQEEITKSISLGENPHQLWQRIQALPSIQPEQKTGHWISVYQGDEIINYRCSECEHGETFGASTYRRDYCNCCGAKMNEEGR